MDTFGFLVAEVRTVGEVAATPWAAEREVFEEVEPGATVPARPFRTRRSTVGAQGRAPRLGEHTRDVLAERLGLDAASLDDLEADGVITSHRPPTTGEMA